MKFKWFPWINWVIAATDRGQMRPWGIYSIFDKITTKQSKRKYVG